MFDNSKHGYFTVGDQVGTAWDAGMEPVIMTITAPASMRSTLFVAYREIAKAIIRSKS